MVIAMYVVAAALAVSGVGLIVGALRNDTTEMDTYERLARYHPARSVADEAQEWLARRG